MDVKFYTTTSAKLPTLPIVNGQLIYLEDKDSGYYDMGNSRHYMSGVRLVSTLPSTGAKDVLYIQIDNSGRATSSVWDETTSQFVSLSGQIATTTDVGVVKPDGTTITIDSNGTISSHEAVQSLPASSITYDNTTSGTTATNAQDALDEISGVANQGLDTAQIAVANASTALNRLDAMDSVVSDILTRLAAVEAVANRALITES